MKLFIVAALIAVTSAARLEHLERSYLPPGQGNYGASSNSIPQGGFGNQGSQYSGSTGFGASGRDSGSTRGSSGSSGFGSHGNGAHGNGFGSNGHASHGFGSQGSNSFGARGGSSGFGSNGVASGRSGADAATINQYLPPDHGPSGSNSGNLGSSIKPACSTCGSSTFGAPQRYSSQQQPTFGSQSQVPATSYGTPQYQAGSKFGSRPTFGAQQDQPQFEASRQYLAPKASSFQNIPQQPFDEQTGYHY